MGRLSSRFFGYSVENIGILKKVSGEENLDIVAVFPCVRFVERNKFERRKITARSAVRVKTGSKPKEAKLSLTSCRYSYTK